MPDSETKAELLKEFKSLQKIESYYWENRTLSVFPPVWFQDDRVHSCQICLQLFNLIRWPHHCQACGISVCANCSKHVMKLPWTDKPSSVCDLCYAIKMIEMQKLQSSSSK